MAEKDKIFSSKIKHTGVFSFKDFYQFCYNWLIDETGVDGVAEKKYKEKIEGEKKNIKIEWLGEKKVTDYFKFEIEVEIKADPIKDIEIKKDNTKIKMNEGLIEMTVKGKLVKDYEGKFERSAFGKFLRAIYEKWVIPSRIEQFEDKLAEDCTEFMEQAKAWLNLEGRK